MSFNFMNVLIYVDIDKNITKEKLKKAGNETQINLLTWVFLYIK